MDGTKGARQACIVGIGETTYWRWGGSDRNEFQLACQAVRTAAADAGLATSELDGLTSFADPPGESSVLQLALGMRALRFAATAWSGRGGGSCGAVALAAAAVESGHADAVAVVRSLCQGRSRRYGRSHAGRTHTNFNAPFGLFGPPQMLALALQRYDHQWGLDPEAMYEVAQTCNDNAQRNPRAVMRGRVLNRESYFASRMIADPLRLFDCCQESDGACAVIVTTLERARDLPGKPVLIAAASQYAEAGWTTGYMGSHNVPIGDYGTGGQVALARHLYQRAGIGPEDIDVIEFYDHFTGMVVIALEDFGFCARGAGSAHVRAGHIRAGGSTPLNTAGGCLAEAYVHGLNQVVEGVRQVRGTSTAQVPEVGHALVTGGSGNFPTSALILRRTT